MKHDWEDIIQNHLNKDSVNPPNHLWSNIKNDLWTSKISQDLNQNAHITPPKNVTQNLWNQPSLAAKSSIATGKWALIVSGIGAVSIAVIAIAQQFYSPKFPETYPLEKIETPVPTDPSNTFHNNTLSSIALHPHIPSSNEFETAHNTASLATPSFGTVKNSHKSDPREPEMATTLAKNNVLEYNQHNALPIFTNSSPDPFIPTQDNLQQDPNDLMAKSLLMNPSVLESIPVGLIGIKSSPQRMRALPRHSHNFYVGLQKNISQQTLTRQTERLDFVRNPPQRIGGLVGGYQLDQKWILESGFHWGSLGYDLNLKDISYYETPVRINPMRKVLRIQTEHHQTDFETRNTAFHAPGVSVRDTQNYYKINYQESINRHYYEIPISIGYAFRYKQFYGSTHIGGRYIISYQTDAHITVTILNPEQTQFVHQVRKPIKDQNIFRGFAQCRAGWQFLPHWDLYANTLWLPTDKAADNEFIRFGGLQMGLNYLF